MKKMIFVLALMLSTAAHANPPDNNSNGRSKFYDFGEQIIDGEIRKPTALYTSARQRAQFDRLLRLKRSFIRELFNTAKNKVFK